MANIPLGLCQCGCGCPTRIALKNSAEYGWIKDQPRRFLQGHHRHLARRPREVRFWEKVDRSDAASCWEWTASRFGTLGYGQFDNQGAHRVAWELVFGPIPAGRSVLHRCDNPPCVNPAHLFLGSPADNSADMVTKGRWNGPGPGERNPNSRLTTDAVRAIRRRAAAGETQRSLATEYGVGEMQISRIVNRQRWRHIT